MSVFFGQGAMPLRRNRAVVMSELFRIITSICIAAMPEACAGAQTYDLHLLHTTGDVGGIGRTGDVALTIVNSQDCSGSEAAVYHDREVKVLACGADAFGINAGGDVVGTATDGGKLWTRSGAEVDVLAPQPNHYTSVRAINDGGFVVGYYSRPQRVTRCFAWTQQGGSFDLGLPNGATSCAAYAVNDRSWIAGAVYSQNDHNGSGFIWKKKHFHLLPILDGMQYCEARSINRQGEAVGDCYTYGAGIVHPVLWKEGNVIDLYPRSGNVTGYAYSINDAGVIVGTLTADDWHGGQAVIYGEVGPVDLATVVRNIGDWHFAWAFGVNKAGEIAANAYSPTQGASAVKLVPVAKGPTPR